MNLKANYDKYHTSGFLDFIIWKTNFCWTHLALIIHQTNEIKELMIMNLALVILEIEKENRMDLTQCLVWAKLRNLEEKDHLVLIPCSNFKESKELDFLPTVERKFWQL
ncbi:MAG: hypothetical protein KGI27_02995 [Thaumarchaeota archaeon]|nr:hypothetical protein [Nitrososphaerota archaeon]